jgi:hypothetical protein
LRREKQRLLDADQGHAVIRCDQGDPGDRPALGQGNGDARAEAVAHRDNVLGVDIRTLRRNVVDGLCDSDNADDAQSNADRRQRVFPAWCSHSISPPMVFRSRIRLRIQGV